MSSRRAKELLSELYALYLERADHKRVYMCYALQCIEEGDIPTASKMLKKVMRYMGS